ncbi:9833_t:CDS:2 [Entrophospora sp. SA101]|nr:7745_t:CDS:2 [Entrophospora sp. SA101]CAJ0832329.1 17838_t:CDS:2 [Entrophospora sp. SA101]CAJ0842119.1 1134_t:CDS:2 [Entrophospora sp. SA101]CAJ0891013.1 9833_t:CDS:2 [Entrophospora sp. SA101]
MVMNEKERALSLLHRRWIDEVIDHGSLFVMIIIYVDYACDDAYGRSIPISPISQQNLSYAQYGQVQSHESVNITQPSSYETNIRINDSEKHLSSASFNNTGSINEKGQFQEPPTPTTQHGNYTNDGLTDSDEDLAKRLYREESENYHGHNTVAGSQTGGMYSPKGEAASYYANVNEPGQRVSGAQIQGTTENTKKHPKPASAYDDPKIQVQLEKRPRWRPYFTWVVTTVHLAMFIYGFIKNQELYGTLIQTQPLNPMIGPSSLVSVAIQGEFDYQFECPSNVGGQFVVQQCPLKTACGFDGRGFRNEVPDQWFRFITPVFLHAGLIHFLFNMLFQLRTGISIERDIGWWRYSIIYMASGIFGFVFGGNFATPTIPSMGASGSLFGIIGILLLDTLQNWKLMKNPCLELTKLMLMILFSFLIGLLPGLDNFSHIGGFIMGILTGMILLPTIKFSKFHKWTTWILRIVAIPAVVLLFFFLIKNFYTSDPRDKCPWCKYLGCLPVFGWCDITGIKQ